MLTTEQKQKLLKARVAVAVCDILGRVPKIEEFDSISTFTQAICKTPAGPNHQRKAGKK